MSRIPLYAPPDAYRTIKTITLMAGASVAMSATNYALVKIGVLSSTGIDYIATHDGSKSPITAGTPLVLYGTSQTPLKVQTGRHLVADITTNGDGSVEGLSVQLRVAHSITDPGQKVSDPQVRAALEGLAQHSGTVGAGEQIVTVPLYDTGKVLRGTFQGRLTRDSATQLSLTAFRGTKVEVAGNVVDIDTAPTMTTSDKIISSAGAPTATAITTSTLYYIYLSMTGLLYAATTAPSDLDGIKYLGTSGLAATLRFVGYARTNASTQWVNTEASRNVINIYNQIPLYMVAVPAYADDNAATSYTTTSTTLVGANGGTGCTITWISDGVTPVTIEVFAVCSNSGANVNRIGMQLDGAGGAMAVGQTVGTTALSCSARYDYVPAEGYHTSDLLIGVTAGTGTFFADATRMGATVDPYATYIRGVVMG